MRVPNLLGLMLVVFLFQFNSYSEGFTGSWQRSGDNGFEALLKTHQESALIKFQLEIHRGAPSYNSGFIAGEFSLQGSKGQFYSDRFGECEINFHFEANQVYLHESQAKSDCGFGHGVHANGQFTLIDGGVPKFSKGDPRATGEP